LSVITPLHGDAVGAAEGDCPLQESQSRSWPSRRRGPRRRRGGLAEAPPGPVAPEHPMPRTVGADPPQDRGDGRGRHPPRTSAISGPVIRSRRRVASLSSLGLALTASGSTPTIASYSLHVTVDPCRRPCCVCLTVGRLIAAPAVPLSTASGGGVVSRGNANAEAVHVGRRLAEREHAAEVCGTASGLVSEATESPAASPRRRLCGSASSQAHSLIFAVPDCGC
jgi:hypothetical protein